MKSTSKATLWLLAGYAIGQGSAFVLQVLVRYSAPENVAGLVVLYLSLFSFCFQFSDIGNSTYANKALLRGDELKFRRFIVGRGMMAIPFVGATLAFFNPGEVQGEGEYALLSVLLVGAFMFSLSEVGRLEVKASYRAFSVAQCAPWVATSVLLWLHFGANAIDRQVMVWGWLLIPFAYILVTKSSFIKSMGSLKGAKRNDVAPSLAFLIPTLFSQMWGRQMLILIASGLSISALGPLGLVRSAHTALSVAMAHLLRPRIRSAIEKDVSGSEIGGHTFGMVKPLIVVLLLILVVCFVPMGIPSDVEYWLPVLLGVPIWGYSSIYTARNQISLLPKVFSEIEIFALCFHVLAFLVVYEYSAAWAFPAADLSRLVAYVVVSKLGSSKITEKVL